MSVSSTMSRATRVYHGPNSNNYPSVGSVSLNESVQVHGIEKDWFYIEYKTSTKNKRGYVPHNTINNASSIENKVKHKSFTGYADVPK
ncbi:MAG: hypothetical protein N4A64_09345, partial [Marinisporobacter sp.]|nr:hypothetical protein [Marinisporobacter sp.]